MAAAAGLHFGLVTEFAMSSPDTSSSTTTSSASQDTVSITLKQSNGSQAVSSSNYFSINYTLNGVSSSIPYTGSPIQITIDPTSAVTITGKSSSSNSTEKWCLTSSCSNVVLQPSAGSSLTFYYYDLLVQTVWYSFLGGSLSSSQTPALSYESAPDSAQATDAPISLTLPLATSTQDIWTIRGQAVSANQSILGKSGERLYILETPSWIISSSNQVPSPLIYYHQYSLTVDSNGIGTTVPFGSEWINASSPARISANPENGSYFQRWDCSGIGCYSGNNQAETVTVGGPMLENASFKGGTTDISFVETGLANGTRWNVTFDGQVAYSTSSAIDFSNVSAGNYSWSAIANITVSSDREKYLADSSNGTLEVISPGTRENVSYVREYYLSLSASEGGSIAGNSGWYPVGEEIILPQPEPESKFTFDGWLGSGNGSYSGSEHSPTIFLYGPINETANFIPMFGNFQFKETGLATGTRWSVLFDEQVAYSTSNTIDFVNISSGSYSWTAMQIISGAENGMRYVSNVSDGTIQIPSTTIETINYTQEFYLNVTAGQGGSLSEKSGWYFSGESVTLPIPKPISNFTFSGWVGTGLGSYTGENIDETVVISGPINETANFALISSVEFETNGLPEGMQWNVTLDGSTKTTNGSSIIFTNVGDGNHTWVTGGPIFSLVGNTRYVPTNSGNFIIEASISQVTQVTLNFTKEFLIEFDSTPAGYGSTSPNGTLWYPAGFVTAIEANADSSNSSFSRWTSNSTVLSFVNSTGDMTDLRVNGPGIILAQFVPLKTSDIKSSPPSLSPAALITSIPMPTVSAPLLASSAVLVSGFVILRKKLKSQKKRAESGSWIW
jgi:hypothetical protein